MTKSKPIVTATTHTLPFEKLSPRDFERLCLWLVEHEGYECAEHLGAAGSEKGRDIVAWREGQRWAFQCKRVQRFGPRDALNEVDKVLALPQEQQPAGLVFLVTCDVSENAREQARRRCQQTGLACDFWTGTELDEKVKRYPRILQEFFRIITTHDRIGPLSAGDLLSACQTQVKYALGGVSRKYNPNLYVNRALEQELTQFFDTRPGGHGSNCFLVVAKAGSGKTNLLCDLARRRVQQQPVLLLLGGSIYISGENGLAGAVQTELEAASPEIAFRNAPDSLHALHCLAEELDRDALILLDAINEYERPVPMRDALEDLLRRTRGRRIKIVVTCRDYYWGLFKGGFWEEASVGNLPIDGDDDPDGGSRDLSRFTSDEHELVLPRYLEHFKIRGGPVGNASEQCRHPLLLRFFCEAYREQDVGEVPNIRLKELFDEYWTRKLASIAERRFRSGDERQIDVLAAEVGDYLMTVANHMLYHNVRSIPLAQVPEVIGWEEPRGDPHSLYFRIRDEFIILEDTKGGQRYSRTRHVVFVYEEFMEYVMALSLMHHWACTNLDEAGILCDIEALTERYEDFERLIGVLVYLALMLRDELNLALWTLLLDRGERWQNVIIEAFRKLPDEQLDTSVFDALNEMLTNCDESVQTQVLDILKVRRVGLRAPVPLVNSVCKLATHDQESVRRRAVLALGVTREPGLVLPALIRSLRDPSECVEANAVSALSKLGEPAIAPLTRALKNEDAFIRRGAAKTLAALRQYTPKSLVEPIIALLEDSSLLVRLAAVEALGELGDARAVDPLIALLEGGDGGAELRPSAREKEREQVSTWHDLLRSWQLKTPDSRRIERADAIVEHGLVIETDPDAGRYEVSGKAVHVQSGAAECQCPDFLYRQEREGRACKHLVALAKHLIGEYQHIDTPRVGRRMRSAAAVSLGKLGALLEDVVLRARLTDCLTGSLADQDEFVRLAVAEALVLVGDAQGLELLVAALGSEAEGIRARATSAFHNLGAEAVTPLVDALGLPSEEVRQGAATMLGELGDRQAIEPLIAALDDPCNKVRDTATKALEGFGRQAVEPLLLVLSEGPSHSKWRAAIALGNLGDSRAVEPLIAALRDRGSRVRRDSAIALRKLGIDPVEPLCTLLLDRDERVRLDAVHTLGRLGDTEAVEPLIVALKDDESGRVRACAAEGLGKLGEVQAVRPLIVALRDGDQHVRSASAEALGKLGDTSAVLPLIDALWDGGRSVQAQAAQALGRLGDEEAVYPLIDALEGSGDWWVRSCTVHALRKIGTPEAIFAVEEHEHTEDDWDADEW